MVFQVQSVQVALPPVWSILLLGSSPCRHQGKLRCLWDWKLMSSHTKLRQNIVGSHVVRFSVFYLQRHRDWQLLNTQILVQQWNRIEIHESRFETQVIFVLVFQQTECLTRIFGSLDVIRGLFLTFAKNKIRSHKDLAPDLLFINRGQNAWK